MELKAKLNKILPETKRLLVLAVGGGNDSVSSLVLINQLKAEFGLNPEILIVSCMLPDVVAYKDIRFFHALAHEIIPITSRWINHKKIEAFPEPLLAENAGQFGIDRVIGLDMSKGSVGVAKALHYIISTELIDTVIAVDIGGDLIATSKNKNVLSPMMDSYALFALRSAFYSNPNVNFLVGLMGLGTDGESTPEMLDDALSNLPEIYQGSLANTQSFMEVESFYHNVIQPNRESRTMSLLCKSIKGFPIHRFNYQYRARFHTQPKLGEIKSHYAYFDHILDEKHSAKYYIFDKLRAVNNPFALETDSSLDWFLKIQNISGKLNHELNGQSIYDSEGNRVVFGTPSGLFSEEERSIILEEIYESIYNNVNQKAFIYTEDHKLKNSGLPAKEDGKLTLIGQTPEA